MLPNNKWILWLYGGACLIFGLKMPSQFSGQISFPPSSNIQPCSCGTFCCGVIWEFPHTSHPVYSLSFGVFWGLGPPYVVRPGMPCPALPSLGLTGPNPELPGSHQRAPLLSGKAPHVLVPPSTGLQHSTHLNLIDWKKIHSRKVEDYVLFAALLRT